MLEVESIHVAYDGVPALSGVDIEVGEGEVVAVLGPSGCGKTTLLRVIGGLAQPDRGRILWNGVDVTGLAPHRRRFGLMFQDYALFPHLDVAGNVGFGLRMQPGGRGSAPARVAEVLELVGLPGYGERAVAGLSGGEAQRVALARALAPAPEMLMLDEPLGSLDRGLRERLMIELRELLAGLGIGALYVTHDHDEAFALADRLAVMDSGRVVQAGPPEAVWLAPTTEFVARFLGFSNVVDAVIVDGTAATPWGDVPLPKAEGGTARLVIRPDAFRPDPDGTVAGTVVARTFRGDHFVVEVETTGGARLEAALQQRFEVDEPIRLAVDPDAVIALR